MCLFVYAFVCACSHMPEDYVGSPGAGVVGDCRLPDIGAGIQIQLP